MQLYQIHLNARCKDARRDLADPYAMHRTLCRAFAPSKEEAVPAGTFLWRCEPETDLAGHARVLVQAHRNADWSKMPKDWLAKINDRGLTGTPLESVLASIPVGRRFRFRIRANPSVASKIEGQRGKRKGIFDLPGQENWLVKQGLRHGFSLATADTDRPAISITEERMLTGRRGDNNKMCVFSVLYEGILRVEEAEPFVSAVKSGIGHGKVMGLGLLSLAAANQEGVWTPCALNLAPSS